MKTQAYILFVAIIGLLFALHYTLYIHLSFIQNDYYFAFLLLIPAILLSAYIFTMIVSEAKESQDRALEHLIKESLHEINLPIATIEANIQMLEKSIKEQKSITKINRIKEALKRLKRLYNLLSYNIKKEILEIEKENISLDKLIKQRVEFFKNFNRNSFILNLEPLEIYTDKIGLEQIIDNIIENAMKYSNKNSAITISLKDTVLIIEDRGIGIDESELPYIYQRYYQAQDSSKGEGIGLSIVKRFCDKEGINLKIESKKGIGTKVILDFKKLKNKVKK